MKGLFRALLWLPAFIWLSVIIYLSVLPGLDVPLPFPGYDKILHFCAYALLSLLFAIPQRGATLWFNVLFIPSFIGGMLEVVQAQIPFRSPDFFDWLSDIAGSLFIFGSIILIKRILARRIH